MLGLKKRKRLKAAQEITKQRLEQEYCSRDSQLGEQASEGLDMLEKELKIVGEYEHNLPLLEAITEAKRKLVDNKKGIAKRVNTAYDKGHRYDEMLEDVDENLNNAHNGLAKYKEMRGLL